MVSKLTIVIPLSGPAMKLPTMASMVDLSGLFPRLSQIFSESSNSAYGVAVKLGRDSASGSR
jgi:hypothetical protein